MKKMFSMNFFLVKSVILVGIIYTVESQSPNEPLFNRGCRAKRGQFPHETYCQQYYNCWDGRATIEECPGKLLFNPVISACDYPEAVNCGGRLRNPEPAVTADGRCLKQFGVFPDVTDCTAFYKCSHGRSYRQICPYYTAFDARYLVCVHAYEVDCGGRGGVYGTLAPPNFNIPVGGISRIGSESAGAGSSASGWDRRSSDQTSGSASGSASIGSQATSPESGTGTGGTRGGSAGGRVGGTGSPATGGIHGISGTVTGTHGPGGPTRGIVGGTGSSAGIADGGVSGSSGRGTSGSSGSARETIGSGGSGRGSGGSSGSGRGAGGSGTSGRVVGPSGTNDGITGTRGGAGASGGTHAGIVGIVDKDISATGQERQYERPVSPEATFRCPHPRGLYPNALNCSRFWLCREYKPSLLQCPTGQLFDLASLSCTNPEKAQCSSISPRT